jgi:hypothetical protein
MKRNLFFLTAALVASGSLYAAPKDDVAAAIKKLADSASYSWTSTPTNLAAAGGGGGGGRGGRGGPASGKYSKTDGLALITRAGRGGAMTDTVVKGTKSVTKNADSGAWETPEERAAGFGGDASTFATLARTQNMLPTEEAQQLLAAVSELKAADGAFAGDLSKEAATTRLAAGRGRGGGGEAPPPPTDVKGSVKFWVKDGVLAKYEFNVQGKTTNFQGDPVDVNRTTTVEIKDVGATKVEVAEDAKKKLQ